MKNFTKILLLPALAFLFLFFYSETTRAQLVVNTGVTPAQLVAGIIGNGISVSNINRNCPSGASGTFSNGNTTNLGITNGSLFTTGCASGVVGANNTTSYGCGSTDFFGFCNYQYSDANLTAIEPQATWDPCILTFNVVPSCSTLTIRFVFGSEEYHEFVNAGYNDVFGFFVTGPNPSGPAYSGYNIARLPNNTPVSIDNINNGNNSGCNATGPCTNCTYFVDNCGGSTIQYDGLTTVITSNLSVTPCATYVFKIAIADAGDCAYDSGVFIDQLFCSSAVAVTTSSQPTCSACTGTATANVSNGQPPYTYSWNTSPVQTTATATGLCPGNYSVTVSDQTACVLNSNTAGVTVTALTSGIASIQSFNNTACGGNTGSATATVSGGTSPFTYLWGTTPPQTTPTAIGLGAGTFSVVATDANGCTSTTSVTITNTTGPTVSANGTPAGCTVANGTATANPSGGALPYTYSWSPSGGNSQTAVGLASGNYTVTVTDANGCSSVATASVSPTSNVPSTTALANNNVSCFGGTNGSATANPSGGTLNYTYAWIPSGGNSQTANNLAAGNYSVLVTDANGCTASSTVAITQPATAVSATPSHTNVLCNAGSTGSATVTATGGTPNYTYVWSPSGGNAQTANNLAAGSYQCIVTDANGCTKTATVTITQPQALAATTTPTNVLCNGGSNGSATATPSGGTPNYTYSWSPIGGNTQTANNLPAGNYTVTVTDANGCTKQTPVAITQPQPITLSVSGNNSICQGEHTTLTATVNGGSPAYTFVWNPASPPGGSSISVSPISSSNYSVAITDANGCTSLVQTYSVTVIPAPNALFDTASSGSFGSTFSFSDLSTPSVTITSWNWNFGDNTSGSTQQNPVHTFPGSGTYTVTEIAFNQSGCPDTFKITIHIREGIIIPNVFTPDGDGVNDVWYIPNSGMKEFNVEIFDRWGAKVFETTADEVRWDGHSRSGHMLTDGTYYYVLKAVLKSGSGQKDYSTTGYVTLLTKKK